MLKNLKNELFRKGISNKSLANFLNVSEKTVQNKLNGITDFSYPEVVKIGSYLFPEYNLSYLFKTEDETKVS